MVECELTMASFSLVHWTIVLKRPWLFVGGESQIGAQRLGTTLSNDMQSGHAVWETGKKL